MEMLQGAMLIWFILTGGSVAFVVWDSATNGVISRVQRTAWILVTVYTGPIGAFMYVLACRRPFPGGHDRYTAVTWKRGLNSEMHCLAGDATGIIVAAAIVPALGLANGWDLLIEYAAGFSFGLFIFQALVMVGMYAGNYFRAVRKTFFAETVSMNLVMTGMIPVMVILAAQWPHSMDPRDMAAPMSATAWPCASSRLALRYSGYWGPTPSCSAPFGSRRGGSRSSFRRCEGSTIGSTAPPCDYRDGGAVPGRS